MKGKDKQKQANTLGNVNKINTKYGKINDQTLFKILLKMLTKINTAI